MTDRMHAADALSWLTQAINDYIRTLPASAAAPTGALAQQAINALQPLVIGPVPRAVDPDTDVTPEGERA